ncbi:hypothetical protein INT45_002373 [Circinella minor]|uniref:Heterokaryon incompatibility domain-containing protein n=1 Tax=Circinella minor TaxID=1195481 RepID=A0A8H7VIW1_9FUNG|nr:hypothetical protein INT45_002373 [Circinella minor]
MYVTYETNPYFIDQATFTVQRHTQPPKLFSTLPKNSNEFMPTKLVRISDMQVIDGSTVNEGYCALSYSWSWCGENGIKDDIQSGKTLRVDNGKHKIIFPAKTVRPKSRGRKKTISAKVKFVKFEGIIQQIGKDFNIKYIWYDQMCIDQADMEEKHHEISRMHQIYSSASCTIVLVPELRTEMWSHNMGTYRAIRTIGLSHSDWMKRMWTLGETMMSPKLLFVGQDTYMSGTTAIEWASLGALADKPSQWNAATILYYAHARGCTKEHDRVFALANLYPNIMEKITINYDQPILDLLLLFYKLLAQEDLSVLCFGRDGEFYKDIQQNAFGSQNRMYDTDRTNIIPIRKYDLPSWTGVAGQHELYGGGTSTGLWKSNFKNYSIDGRFMNVHCTPIWSIDDPRSTINIDPFTAIDPKDLPYLPEEKHDSYNTLAVKVQFPGCRNPKVMHARFHQPSSKNQELNRTLITERMALLSLFMPINKEQFFWVENQSKLDADGTLTCFVPSLTEQIDYSAKYAILYGISFQDDKNGKEKMYPIVRQDGDYYKAVGHCLISNAEDFFSDYTLLPEQTFIIH